MSARTSFRPWEYRKIDETLLQLALNFPNYDKKSDTVTVTDSKCSKILFTQSVNNPTLEN